ncbi:MAG: DNA primase small subunit PriS [Candidatus Thermoplasmatota archaeon]
MKGRSKTKRFLSRVLRDHYSSKIPSLPYRFTRREFAFVYFNSEGMHRPVAFGSRDELNSFLKKKTPLHSYYSTAYYSNPEDPMREKEWLGADLVFDLDADHIPGSEELNYIEQLEKVKEKCRLLIHDFLMDDFGFGKDDMEIYFSGHRGYHVHVRDDDILSLSAQARREIVDHITGVGLDLGVILPDQRIKVGEFQDKDITKESPRLPPEDEGGWRKKTRRLTEELLKRWGKMNKSEVVEEMKEKHGIGTKTAKGLYEDLYEKGKWKKILDEGTLDIFSEDKRMVNVKSFKKIIKGILNEENVQEIGSQIIGATDEPVTGDTKRLIRLPHSIHGGSFLVVKDLTIDEIKRFDPLSDALPIFLSDKSYDIEFETLPDIERIKIKDQWFNIEKKMDIPEFAAPFMISKLGAKLL